MNVPKPRWQLMFASVILVVFLVVLFILIRASESSTDIRWIRLTYLFGSLEAITFTAVGWMFGSEVHRKRAEVAEANAEAEGARAEAMTKRASAADAMEAAIMAEATVAGAGTTLGDPDDGLLGHVDSEGGAGGSAAVRRLLVVVHRLQAQETQSADPTIDRSRAPS